MTNINLITNVFGLDGLSLITECLLTLFLSWLCLAPVHFQKTRKQVLSLIASFTTLHLLLRTCTHKNSSSLIYQWCHHLYNANPRTCSQYYRPVVRVFWGLQVIIVDAFVKIKDVFKTVFCCDRVMSVSHNMHWSQLTWSLGVLNLF